MNSRNRAGSATTKDLAIRQPASSAKAPAKAKGPAKSGTPSQARPAARQRGTTGPDAALAAGKPADAGESAAPSADRKPRRKAGSRKAGSRKAGSRKTGGAAKPSTKTPSTKARAARTAPAGTSPGTARTTQRGAVKKSAPRPPGDEAVDTSPARAPTAEPAKVATETPAAPNRLTPSTARRLPAAEATAPRRFVPQTPVDPPLVFLDDEDDDLEPTRPAWWKGHSWPWSLWRYSTLEVTRVVILSLLTISLLYAALAAYQVVRNGLQVSYVWPFLLKSLAYPLYFSIPVSLLFGVTLALGRMVHDGEVAAMRFHGASHVQLFLPVVLVGTILAGSAYWVNGYVIPELHYEKRNLQQYVIKQLENLGEGRNRTFRLPDGGGNILVGAYDGQDLWRVEVDLDRKMQSRFVPEIQGQLPQGLPETITLLAQRGRLEIAPDRRGVVIHLHGVEVLVPETVVRDKRFDQHFVVTENLAIPLSFERRARAQKDLIQPALAAHITELRAALAASDQPDPRRVRLLRGARAQWHRRLAFTLAALTFPFVAAGLCLVLQRRGRLAPFFCGNLVVIGAFFPLLMVGSSLLERGLDPTVALAIPNVVLLGFGLFLVERLKKQ